MSTRDKALCTEIVYGVLRRKNFLEWILAKLSSKPLNKLDFSIYAIILIALYQIIFLDRIPASAAVNEAVKLAKKHTHKGGAGFTNGVLRNFLRRRKTFILPDKNKHLVEYLSLFYNQPQWFVEFSISLWGTDKAVELLDYYTKIQPISIRVNTIKISTEEIMDKLKEKNVFVQPTLIPEGLFLAFDSLDKIKPFLYEGLVYIQDIASMWVSYAVNPQHKNKLLDLCAAPGGKTTHMAAIMENTGSICACDLYPHKIELIRENCSKMGVKRVNIEQHDAVSPRSEWNEQFDSVLADVPCSGLGVIGKRPDLKWRRKEEDLADFPPLQKSILANAGKYVKKGGKLIYSTCTLNPAENENIVHEFLSNNDNYCLVPFELPGIGVIKEGETTIWPPTYQTDGFYIAVMQKDE